MRVPVATPAGTFTVSERRLRMRPWPAHSLHGSLITVPKPSQLPHGAVVMTWPRMERTARWTWPLPPQMSQRSGWVPGAAAGAFTRRAGHGGVHFELFVDAEDGVAEFDPDADQGVLAAADPGRRAGLAAGAAEERSKMSWKAKPWPA